MKHIVLDRLINSQINDVKVKFNMNSHVGDITDFAKSTHLYSSGYKRNPCNV